MLETVLVWLLAPRSALGLAAQGTAPPPFDVFHDVRWLVVYHESWFGFVCEVLAFFVLRGLLTALIVRAAWPEDIAPEPLSVTLRRGVVYTAIVAALFVPWVGLLFAMAVVSLSWLFFVAVPVVLMLALLVHGAAVSDTWWRRTLPARSLGWVMVAFGALTMFGSVLATCAPWLRVPVAAVAGLVNAAIWLRIVDAVLHRRRAPRRVAVAPIGVGIVLAVVVGGTTVGFALSDTSAERVARAASRGVVDNDEGVLTASGTGGPLVVVTGFNTQWNGRPDDFVKLAVPQRRFSYRGMQNGAPLPYARNDTHRSLRVLAKELRAQVDEYARVSGQAVTIVAESEGSLVAKAYLAASPGAPVRNLVILSPLVDPGRVYYPSDGNEGWGAFGGLELSGIAWALGGVSPVDVEPDTPFLRSIVDHAPAVSALMACDIPRVRELAVLPLDTAVSATPRDLGIPFTVVPGFHGGMLDDKTTARLVRRVVDGRPVPRDSAWVVAEGVISAGATAWQVPRLAADINDAWHDAPRTDDCRAVRAHLQRWLGE